MSLVYIEWCKQSVWLNAAVFVCVSLPLSPAYIVMPFKPNGTYYRTFLLPCEVCSLTHAYLDKFSACPVAAHETQFVRVYILQESCPYILRIRSQITSDLLTLHDTKACKD
jgi:hypothetical protein